ncbi:MAG: type II secretion system protein [Candidatus Eisenbacteria bacterium]|uniref:Type II secretion system protein n=1 Tax=Eiseniibacteriota bacterium TaxID=2212470 RepID=A0A956NE97_UNCEI|nr:type II secretion system protein [Candidatus Eisenbacteria bacterium]
MIQTRARSSRGGFTLVELMFVITIIGLLVKFAAPYVQNVRTGADASAVMADLNTIRLAGFDYLVEHGEFPRSGPLGAPPPSLADRLPAGFEFQYKDARYMWLSSRWRGSEIYAGPLVWGPPELVDQVAKLSSNERIRARGICWFVYTN